jgi:hypothetical protein
LRLSEREARTFLLVRAVEETDQEGVLLPPRTRAAATRRVFDEPARKTDTDARMRARAALLREDLLREAPALNRVIDPPRPRSVVVLATIVLAFLVGALANLLGPERRVSILAFPLAGILAWNVAIYAGVVAQWILRATAPLHRTGRTTSRLAFAARWLEGMRVAGLARRLGGSARSVAVTDAIDRFHRLWVTTATPLVAARVRIVLHVAAAAMALGAIAGLYASGIAFEYRATWESTWLDAPVVQRYLDTVLGPASRVLDVPVPDVALMRGPVGEGPAAPWIHLWAVTLVLFVVVPRAALALVDVLTAARLAHWLPVDVDVAYARRALHSGRGAASVVDVVYYSCAPDAGLRERLHTLLQEQAGARAVVRDAAQLDYGDAADRVALGDDAAVSGRIVVVFALAQTPEAEVHGEFLGKLLDRVDRAGWELVVVLETATYRQRVGSAERVRERRATWERLLRDLGVTATELE